MFDKSSRGTRGIAHRLDNCRFSQPAICCGDHRRFKARRQPFEPARTRCANLHRFGRTARSQAASSASAARYSQSASVSMNLAAYRRWRSVDLVGYRAQGLPTSQASGDAFTLFDRERTLGALTLHRCAIPPVRFRVLKTPVDPRPSKWAISRSRVTLRSISPKAPHCSLSGEMIVSDHNSRSMLRFYCVAMTG